LTALRDRIQKTQLSKDKGKNVRSFCWCLSNHRDEQ